jgi:hypothetical protein
VIPLPWQVPERVQVHYTPLININTLVRIHQETPVQLLAPGLRIQTTIMVEMLHLVPAR